jgi:hypothetical protein
MIKIKTIDTPQLSCELEEFLAATDADLNLAQQVSDWNLKLKEGVYTDREFFYYSVMMEVPVRGILSKTTNKQVWIRSTIKMSNGGRWEPDHYDEVLVDGEEVFMCLSDAVKQSKLDAYERELMEMNNFCPICDGSGVEDYPEVCCSACNGKGYNFYIKPQKNK